MTPEDAVRAVRPDVRVRCVRNDGDEVVLAGGDEVFRVPLTPAAVERHAVLVRALPVLRLKLPVAVAPPRYVGVLDDGTTPFLAERRLAGVPATGALGPIASGQLAGVLAALAAVPPREAQQWGVTGDGALLHGALAPTAVLVDAGRGVLTGIVGWRPRLGDPADDRAALGALAP